MGKKTEAPPPPDPNQVAAAQTAQNRDTALYNAALNRFNTYTPFGSQEFSVTGTDPRTGAPIYQQDIRLDPSQQALFDQQTNQNLALGQYGNTVLDRLTNAGPISVGPDFQTGYNFAPINTALDPSIGLQSGFNQADPQMRLDTGNLPGLPTDLGAFRDEAEDALYARNTRFMDRDFDRREDQLRTRLANQGITEGSEAFENALTDFGQDREQAYQRAREDAIAGGGAEASRMFDIGSRSRGQLFGDRDWETSP